MQKTILRSAVSGVAMLGALSIAAPGMAANTTLNIVRDQGGGVIQSIPVESWSYDRKKQLVTVATTDGDRHCPGAPSSGSWSGAYMQLDGHHYRLEKVLLPTSRTGTLTVTPLRDDVFPLCASASNSALQQRYVAKAEGDLKVEMDAIAGGRVVNRAFAVSAGISFDAATGLVIAGNAVAPSTLSEDWPPLCLQTATGDNELQFVDTNGQSIVLQDIDPVEFRFGEGVFALTRGPGLTCFAVPGTQESPLEKGDASGCAASNGLFGSSFENVTNIAIDALSVSAEINTYPTDGSIADDPLDYDLVVENCTGQTLENIFVRDFYSSTLAAVGGSYTAFTIPSLAPGAQHVQNVTRTVNGSLGDEVIITAVAAVDDGSDVPQHQIRSWAISVLSTNNEAPTLTGSASLTMDEDDPATPVGGLLAADTDSGFNCPDGSCVQVSSADPSIVAASGVSATFDSGAITLSVTPQSNAFTPEGQPVDLSVRVQDADGALSNAVIVPVTVTAVNDPPTFEVGNGFDETATAKILTPSPTPYCTLVQSAPNGDFALADANCPKHSWPSGLSGLDAVLDYNGWIANRSDGPGETGNVTLALSTSDPLGVLTSVKFDSATGDLEYQGTGEKGSATLTVTATDSQGASTSVDIIVDVANSSPVIDSNGGGDTAAISIDENETDVTIVNATDADDDASAISYAINGGADAGFFSIDAVSGVLAFTAAPDFESPADSNADNAYEVTVTASDGSGGNDSQAITVTVQDVNEPPVIEAGQVFTVDENAPKDTVVGTVSVSDPEGDSISNWQIIAGNTDVNSNGFEPFDRNGADIEVLDSGDLDFETTPQFVLTVEASDGINPAVSEDITINLNDVAE